MYLQGDGSNDVWSIITPNLCKRNDRICKHFWSFLFREFLSSIFSILLRNFNWNISTYIRVGSPKLKKLVKPNFFINVYFEMKVPNFHVATLT